MKVMRLLLLLLSHNFPDPIKQARMQECKNVRIQECNYTITRNLAPCAGLISRYCRGLYLQHNGPLDRWTAKSQTDNSLRELDAIM